MRRSLEVDFTREEIKIVLNQMHPSKAPDLDGMPPLFFLKYWDIIGQEIIEAVLEALSLGNLPSDLNQTFITFIPKKKRPEYVVDFYPISICNVLYKIVAKALTNRLKVIL